MINTATPRWGACRQIGAVFTVVIILTSLSYAPMRDGVTVPFALDHNRMIIQAEIQKPDGAWRSVRLWVDSGNPDFFISESLAHDLEIDLPQVHTAEQNGLPEVTTPKQIRLGAMPLDFSAAKTRVLLSPKWLFSTMHVDANLPSTVLKKYQAIFDYPAGKLILAKPGTLKPRGVRNNAYIHPQTGIVQMDAKIDDESLSFALDNGASYSFSSAALVERILERHPDCAVTLGAVGHANIWGWWPGEESWKIIRTPEIIWGAQHLSGIGLVGLPETFPLALWYSKKTARPVDGILGPNAMHDCRVEIDYQNNAVYFAKTGSSDWRDMDLVGLTLRPLASGDYAILGRAQKDDTDDLPAVQSGDILAKVDDLIVKDATMGTVIDALRGKPGDTHRLTIERNGEIFKVTGTVKRYL